MPTITYSGQLTVCICWCGMRHAIPVELDMAMSLDHKQGAFCPLGHSYVRSGKTEAEKLRDTLAEKERQLEAARATQRRLRESVEHQEARVRGYQGALAKSKKRAAKGVCPAPGCKRSFVDVAKHVATKHPSLVAEPGAGAAE
jgi:hypothetical protein